MEAKIPNSVQQVLNLCKHTIIDLRDARYWHPIMQDDIDAALASIDLVYDDAGSITEFKQERRAELSKDGKFIFHAEDNGTGQVTAEAVGDPNFLFTVTLMLASKVCAMTKVSPARFAVELMTHMNKGE